MAVSWKYYAKLRQKKYRQQEGKFLVEGVRLTHEALLSDWQIEIAFVAPDFPESDHWLQFEEFFKQRQIPYRILPAAHFQRLADTETPQGIVLAVKIPQRELSQLNLRNADFVVILQGVRDPGNLGTIIRTADWYGVNAVLLSDDCVDPYNPKVVRSTMGSIFHVPVVRLTDLQHGLAELKKHRFRIIATSVDHGKVVHRVQFKKPAALILGGEVRGVSPHLLDAADLTVRIWKYGKAESLNVAVAGGILMDRIAQSIYR